MKILFLSPMVPYPLEQGGNGRTLTVLKSLCQRHEVHLLSFIESDLERAYLSDLRSICANVETVSKTIHLGQTTFLRPLTAVASFFTEDAYSIYKFRSSAMREKVQKAIAELRPDLIHIEHLSMSSYVLKRTAALRVLHEHNAEHLSVQRFSSATSNLLKKVFAMADHYKLKAYEARVCAQMDGIIGVSSEVRDEISLLADVRDRTVIIPSGVNTDYWKPENVPYDSNTITFVGSMCYPPNIHAVLWFVRQVFPLVRQRIPNARFQIVGANPVREIQALGGDKDILVTGYVPDVRPYLISSAVSVFPIFFGGGVKIKVLLSLAMGIPVVSTRMSAEGIEVVDERSVLFAEDPVSFAEKVVGVMTNAHRRAALAREGRILVESSYTEEVMQRSVLDAYHMFCKDCSGPLASRDDAAA
jgi:sugar transferase (PEP-CTERM/EpsH1 system associated)